MVRKLSTLLFSHRSSLHGYRIVRELGTVSGCCSQCGGILGETREHATRLVGGPINAAKANLSLTVKTATKRALAAAEKQGANCVVNMREQIATSLVRRPFVFWSPPSTFYFAHVSGTAVTVVKMSKDELRRQDEREKAERKRGVPPLAAVSPVPGRHHSSRKHGKKKLDVTGI